MGPRILGLAKMFAIAVAALAAPAPYDLREAAQNVTPKAREPLFAPSLVPCDAGFTPTCEQAKGFGLCDAASSACDTTCVDEVKKNKIFLASSPPPRLGTVTIRTQERWECASPPLALTTQDSMPR